MDEDAKYLSIARSLTNTRLRSILSNVFFGKWWHRDSRLYTWEKDRAVQRFIQREDRDHVLPKINFAPPLRNSLYLLGEKSWSCHIILSFKLHNIWEYWAVVSWCESNTVNDTFSLCNEKIEWQKLKRLGKIK